MEQTQKNRTEEYNKRGNCQGGQGKGMSKPDIEYEQSDDYEVVYADNVILKMGNENSKLIFYQEVTKLNQNNGGIEKNKKYKQLKFEIRIPTYFR